MWHAGEGPAPRRPMLEAERHVPDLLQWFLTELEMTETTEQVWQLIVRLGRTLDLPFVDLIASSLQSACRRPLFVRSSHDTGWLEAFGSDAEIGRWSYLRGHAAAHLTPITIGLEFLSEYRVLPERRIEVLREAARRRMRAGVAFPLRQGTPPRAGMLSFSGDHSRREMLAILHAHGWTLSTAALLGHQRFAACFAREFPLRRQITEKQMELLGLIGSGLHDKEIAGVLEISVSAVRQRLQALCARTGMTSRAELAALAMSLGVLPDPLQPGLDPSGPEAARCVF
ncbi:helix-turn-helix transcriptional regulator [Alloyangia pacifica]|uniref:helix-turn-helix transcriptional regulator n=1 Tax=Alloyangia pacifica TaxID=311180 RepID=UPI001CD56C6E|nr:helix-turn-helix transcriptional regulator [Alloyangia pacifica]MCA0995947.1 helix-turn-helix transcriptional regulator [Alloyangia pacifica]